MQISKSESNNMFRAVRSLLAGDAANNSPGKRRRFLDADIEAMEELSIVEKVRMQRSREGKVNKGGQKENAAASSSDVELVEQPNTGRKSHWLSLGLNKKWSSVPDAPALPQHRTEEVRTPRCGTMCCSLRTKCCCWCFIVLLIILLLLIFRKILPFLVFL